MKLQVIDIVIILVYFLTVILIGLWVSRRGAKDLDSCFLGSKSLPWYLLGVRREQPPPAHTTSL
jgi:solute:Na+ symporter, SSS family